MNNIFDELLHKLNLERAISKWHKHDFIIKETSYNICQRLKDFSKKFEDVLVYGLFDQPLMTFNNAVYGYPIKELNILNHTQTIDVVALSEENRFDLIVSNISLSFSNDIISVLLSYHKALRSGGVLIATLYGGQTLKELREAFYTTDDIFYNKLYPRVIPFIKSDSAINLLKQTGFNALVDSYNIEVEYQKLSSLLQDIKGMGQSNCLFDRKKTIDSKFYFKVLEHNYKQMYNLKATFEILTLTGFKS